MSGNRNKWKMFQEMENVPGTVELPGIRPVLNLQIRNTGKFGRVRSDDSETAGAADCSDFEIVRADHAAGGFELVADIGVVPRGSVVKRQRNKTREQFFKHH
jgi:hypothetical protein